MNRSADWLKQAERDLEIARLNLNGGAFEWACFIAQQAAEKAVKALCEKYNILTRNHQLTRLLGDIRTVETVPGEIYEKGAVLDRFYIPTRYPNGFGSGAPMDYFFQKDSEDAISYAEEIVKFCCDKITR